MPVNLLGLMAIAMFYIITVVVGLCANRCLAHEDDEDGPEDEGGGGPEDSVARASDREAQLELVKLIETFHVASLARNSAPASPRLVLHPADALDAEEEEDGTRQRHHPACSRREERREDEQSSPSLGRVSTPRSHLPPAGKYLLAERNVGILLGSLSILAIRTGGVFSNTIAQSVYDQGLLWCQVPIAASLSLIIGGLVEMLLGFSGLVGVVGSVGAIMFYLLAGGLYAGTLTDAAQFIYLSVGTWIMVPFAVANPYLKDHASLGNNIGNWLGEIKGKHSGIYIDQLALLVLGGIPMQSYFQRVFSSTSPKAARWMTVIGSLGCLVNAIPAVLIGASAAATEWGNTTLGAAPATGLNSSLILARGLHTLVPHSLLFLILGALASGLLAAADSALFGLATIITHNCYRNWLKPHASETELIWLARLSVAVLAGAALLLCLAWPHWHSLWLIPYDILYVLVFPQLFCACYFRYANTIGAASGLVVGLAVRLLFGESRVGLPALLRLPFWERREGQLFPYRTLAMLTNLLVTIAVSALAHVAWRRGRLAASPNDLCCVQKRVLVGAPQPPASTPRGRWRPPDELGNSFLDLAAPGAAVALAPLGPSPTSLSRGQAARLLAAEYAQREEGFRVPQIQRMTVL